MNSFKNKFLSNHIYPIGFLFFIVSAILLLTGTIPQISEYNIYGCFNLFMYFAFILGILSFLYCFIRFQTYLFIYKKVCIFLHYLKNPTVCRRFIKNTVIVIGILLISIIFEIVYSRFMIGTPNSLGTYFNPYRFLFILSTLLVVFTLFKLRNTLLVHTERAFLIIALICGLLMVYSSHTNTSVSWDDHIHYNTANSLIGLTEYSRTTTEREFYEIPTDSRYLFSSDFFNMQNYKTHQKQYNSLDETGDSSVSPSSYSAIVQRICYFPAAFFLALGRLLGLPFHNRFILGRIGNLLVYAFAIYLGIKKLRSGKMLLAGIGLLPTCLFIAVNYSYDYWVISLSLLGFAYFYSAIQTPGETLSFSHRAIMIGSLFLAFTPKAVYFPMLMLLYFMPKYKFRNQKDYKSYLIAVTCALLYLLLSFVIPSIIGGPSTDTRGGADVNGAAQVIYILKNPLTYTKTLLTFLKTYLSLPTTKDYTTFLAYYGYGSKYIFLIVLISLYAFLDRHDAVRYTSKYYFRGFSLICCFCSICLVATALFVAYTPVAATQINGCQPRYILPLIFPFLYILGSSRTTGYFTKNWHYLISLALSSYILLATFWTTCIGLYY